MQIILGQMAVLFILLAIGFGCGRIKLLNADASKYLSKIIINVSAPCTILNSVLSGDVSITAGETVKFLLISFLAYSIFLLISIPLARVYGGVKSARGLYGYMAAFGNTAFMGFPVVIAIFGASSAYYVALFNIPFLLLTFSLGIVLISGRGFKFDPKVFLNPSIIAAFIATAIAVVGIRAPVVVTEPIRLLASMTTPGSMLVIGATLAGVSFKVVFSEWRLFPAAFLKLIVMPVAVWFVFRFFVFDETLLGILVILSGMPTAAMAAMVAIEYGGNERVASGGVSLTTLLSGVTVPLIVYLLL